MRVKLLRGGLESTTVARVVMCPRQDHGGHSVTFVLKRLHDDSLREAMVYDWLATSGCADFAPRCFAIEPASDGSRWLFLEALTPVARWPWRQFEHVSAAVYALAELHQAASAAGFQACVPDLGYDAELTHSSLRTLRVFDAAAATREPWLRSFGPALRRVVDSLPILRRQVSAAVGLTPAVLHGDVRVPCATPAGWRARRIALAGALEYNLEVMLCPTATARQRYTAGRATREWLRIIRRADAVWQIRGDGRMGHRGCERSSNNSTSRDPVDRDLTTVVMLDNRGDRSPIELDSCPRACRATD